MLWWIIGILIISAIIYFLYNIISPTYAERDLIRTNVKNYLKARSASKSHEEAIDYVLWSRYPLSEEPRQKVSDYFMKGLASGDNEFEQLKKLVYSIYNYEVLGGEHEIKDAYGVIHKSKYAEIEDVINKINKEYQITLK